MPASAVWEICGIDTLGRDLTLSQILPWGASGPLEVVTLTCSFAPSQGALGSLLLPDANAVTFAARDVRQPGFTLTFTFAQPVDLWGFRFAGPSQREWVYRHSVRSTAVAQAFGTVQWAGVDVLSPQPSGAPTWSDEAGSWGKLSGASNRSWGGCALSSDGTTVLAGSFGGGLTLSKNRGVSFQELAAASSSNWYGCAVSSDGAVLLASASDGTIMRSRDGGVTWLATSISGAGRSWRACAVSDSGQVMLVAEGGGSGYLWLSTDFGETWVPMSGAGNRSWWGCSVSGDGSVLLAADFASGNLWMSSDRGATWTAKTGAGARNWVDCDVSQDGKVLIASAYGNQGQVWVSRDAGASWAAQIALPTGDWYGSSVSGNGKVLVCANNNGLLAVSRDAGTSWDVRSNFAGTALWRSVAVSRSGICALASGVGSGGSAAALWMLGMGDPIYLSPPLVAGPIRQMGIKAGVEPMAQGLGGTHLVAAPVRALDTEFGGRGMFYGTVRDEKTKARLQRRVRLHRSRDGMLVRETWSKADGSYAFTGINERYEYDIEAWDHEKNYFTTVANNQLPEVV